MSEEEAIEAAIQDAVEDGALANLHAPNDARIRDAVIFASRPHERADHSFIEAMVAKVRETYRA